MSRYANRPAPVSDELTPDQFDELARGLAVMLRLLHLDKHWTSEAKSASDPRTRDQSKVDALAKVVDEMERLFTELRDLAPRLAAIFGRPGSPLQKRFDEFAADNGPRSDPRKERAVPRMRHHLEKTNGNAVDYAVQAAELIGNRADTEIEQLRAEYARVAGAQNSDGDMSNEAHAAIDAAAIAVGFELGGPIGGAVALAVAECLIG